MCIIPRIVRAGITGRRRGYRSIPSYRTLTGFTRYIGVLQTLPVIKAQIEIDVIRIEESDEIGVLVFIFIACCHTQFHPFGIAVHIYFCAFLRCISHFRCRSGHREYIVIYIRPELRNRRAAHLDIQQLRRIRMRHIQRDRIYFVRFSRIERLDGDGGRFIDAAVDYLHFLLRIVLGDRDDVYPRCAVRHVNREVRSLRHVERADTVQDDGQQLVRLIRESQLVRERIGSLRAVFGGHYDCRRLAQRGFCDHKRLLRFGTLYRQRGRMRRAVRQSDTRISLGSRIEGEVHTVDLYGSQVRIARFSYREVDRIGLLGGLVGCFHFNECRVVHRTMFDGDNLTRRTCYRHDCRHLESMPSQRIGVLHRIRIEIRIGFAVDIECG